MSSRLNVSLTDELRSYVNTRACVMPMCMPHRVNILVI